MKPFSSSPFRFFLLLYSLLSSTHSASGLPSRCFPLTPLLPSFPPTLLLFLVSSSVPVTSFHLSSPLSAPPAATCSLILHSSSSSVPSPLSVPPLVLFSASLPPPPTKGGERETNTAYLQCSCKYFHMKVLCWVLKPFSSKLPSGFTAEISPPGYYCNLLCGRQCSWSVFSDDCLGIYRHLEAKSCIM